MQGQPAPHMVGHKALASASRAAYVSHSCALRPLPSSVPKALPHELMTPLTGVLGWGEILQVNAELLTQQEVTEIGTDLVHAGKRLKHLLENLLLYSETESLLAKRNEASPHNRETSFDTLLIVETGRQVAPQWSRSRDLRTQIPAQTVAVAYPELLQKAIYELTDNAFKFSAPGAPVLVCASISDSCLHIEIQDQGCGMTAAQLQAVDAFVQFNRESREQQGIGLGLVLAKRIIHLNGGELTIESSPGKGTVVRAKIPLLA